MLFVGAPVIVMARSGLPSTASPPARSSFMLVQPPQVFARQLVPTSFLFQLGMRPRPPQPPPFCFAQHPVFSSLFMLVVLRLSPSSMRMTFTSVGVAR